MPDLGVDAGERNAKLSSLNSEHHVAVLCVAPTNSASPHLKRDGELAHVCIVAPDGGELEACLPHLQTEVHDYAFTCFVR
jgi:hypothetical protein